MPFDLIYCASGSNQCNALSFIHTHIHTFTYTDHWIHLDIQFRIEFDQYFGYIFVLYSAIILVLILLKLVFDHLARTTFSDINKLDRNDTIRYDTIDAKK